MLFRSKQLRGEKGVKIMLRDAHGRIQGSYQNGKLDRKPVAGKDLTLGLEVKLQALDMVINLIPSNKPSRASQRQVNGLRPPLTAPPVLAGE